MDGPTYYKAMRAFCLQRARMEHECTTFWTSEASYWSRRLVIAQLFRTALAGGTCDASDSRRHVPGY